MQKTVLIMNGLYKWKYIFSNSGLLYRVYEYFQINNDLEAYKDLKSHFSVMVILPRFLSIMKIQAIGLIVQL